MKRNDAVVIMYMENIQPIPTQRRVLAAQPHHLAREAMLVGHMLVTSLKPLPPNQQLRPTRPVGPILVFQKLLPHEDHRHAGRREQNTGSYFRAATRIPGPRIGRVGKRGDTRLPVAVADVKQIVILDTLKHCPSTGSL